MDYDFDEQQKLLKKTAENFNQRELEPFMESYPEEPLPRDAVFKLMKMVQPFGLLGARVPQDGGGEGMSHVTIGLLFEIFHPEVTLACTNDVMALRLYHGASDDLKEKYIPPLIRGDILGGSCISEPNSGSDLTSLETTAKLDGDHYVVNGTKIWSSHGSISDVILAAVSFGKDARGRTILGRLFIDRAQSEVRGRDIKMIGLKRHHLSEIVFEDCRVPKGNLVGEPGDAKSVFTLSWLSQRPLIGMMSVHLAQKALDISIDYARERREFGRPIGAFQLVQAMLVDIATLAETSRHLCYKALHQLDKGVYARLESSLAKAYATESGVKATYLGMQVLGAYGLSSEYKLERYFRDARMLTMPDGTVEIQKLMAGRQLLGINAIR